MNRQTDSDQGDSENPLSYTQIQGQNSLEMLKQIDAQEEKIEKLTEENIFLKEENSLLKEQNEDAQNDKEKLEHTLQSLQENYEQWMKESEENQTKIKALTQKIEKQMLQIDEQKSQLSDLIEQKKRVDKQQFQQKLQFDFDVKAVKSQSQREVDKIRRELEEKMEKQIKQIKNQSFTHQLTSQDAVSHNLLEGKDRVSLEMQISAAKDQALQKKQMDISVMPENIEELISKAVKEKEAILLEEARQNEEITKKFYDNAFKQLCEDFERESKKNEESLKQFYDNLMSDSKKHHSKLQESLISDNTNSYDQVVQDVLQKASQFEAQYQLERQFNLEQTLQLKKTTIEASLAQKKSKEMEEEVILLKHKIEEQNLESLKQKRQNESKCIELDYLYKVEKEKYLATLRREKDISKQMQLLETSHEEFLKKQNNVSSSELNEIKQLIKRQYEDQVNKLCLEQSMQISKFAEEFQNFKDLSNKRYNSLKLKYEELMLIHKTKTESPSHPPPLLQEPSKQKQDKSPSPKRQKESDSSLLHSSTANNGLMEKNVTQRAYTSFSQYREESRYKNSDFGKFSQSIDCNSTLGGKESKNLLQTYSEISKQGKTLSNSFMGKSILNADRLEKQNQQQNIGTKKVEINFDGPVYLKKYPFTRVNQIVKNYSTIDPRKELNQTFSVQRQGERSQSKERSQFSKYQSLTPNRVNQSLDINQLDEQQKKMESNKKMYQQRKYNIYESNTSDQDQQLMGDEEEVSPQLDNFQVHLNSSSFQFHPNKNNKTGYGQTFTDQINFKHNQLYSTLKHFKNNTIKIERKQIKLSNLPTMGSNN